MDQVPLRRDGEREGGRGEVAGGGATQAAHADLCGVDVSKPVAIITGAGKGIGRATAVALGGKGYELVLVARTESDLSETAKLAGGGVIVVADVSRLDEIKRVIADAIK